MLLSECILMTILLFLGLLALFLLGCLIYVCPVLGLILAIFCLIVYLMWAFTNDKIKLKKKKK